MNVHFLCRERLEKPSVLLYPEIIVCLDCGLEEFSVPDAELSKLATAQQRKPHPD